MTAHACSDIRQHTHKSCKIENETSYDTYTTVFPRFKVQGSPFLGGWYFLPGVTQTDNVKGCDEKERAQYGGDVAVPVSADENK